MADKKNTSRFKYKIELSYVDTLKNRVKEISYESIKSLIIDHDYEKNNMPVLYCVISLDKALIDDMILNIDTSLITLTLYKYDDYANSALEIVCFREQFTYFLPGDINTNDEIDYNRGNEEEMQDSTLRRISIGLLCVNHINANKKSFNTTMKNTTMYDAVKYCTGHIKNILIEPFVYNNTFDQLIIPPIDSVSKTLRFLNDYKVFYPTPYRYYLDFNIAYLISSSGRAVLSKDDKYGSVVVSIQKILNDDSNDPGIITNISKGSYEVIVSYLNTTVSNNSIIGKSKTEIKGITSSGSVTKSLNFNSSYTSDKTSNIRINNDNEKMIDNLAFDMKTKKVSISINKNDLDTNMFTINRRITVHHIEKYQMYDGTYLMNRKKEVFLREGDSFVMTALIELKKIDD